MKTDTRTASYREELKIEKPLEEVDSYGEVVGCYEVEERGLLQFMPNADYATAYLGTFERVDDRRTVYSVTVIADMNGIIVDYHSAYMDDLKALKNGNVELHN